MARPAPSRRSRYRRADPTRRRLTDAAIVEFADNGFRHGTTRAICRRAGTNCAMANYHFGSKQALYRAAVREALGRAQRDAPMELDAPPPKDRIEARARLRECVAAFATGLLGKRPAPHRRLLLRELAEPAGALAGLVDELIRPRFEALRRAVAGLAPAADGREVTWAALAVLGQIVYHKTARPIALSLLGEREYGAPLVAEIIERVSSFSERALGIGDDSASSAGGAA